MLAALFYVAVLIVHRGDPFILVTLGSEFAPAELQQHTYSTPGYDGQFSYYLARYGLEHRELFDVPAYRAQRILLPALAAALSLGQADWLVWALLAVNLVALALGAYWLELLLVKRGAPIWPALAFALSMGMLGAVRMTTNEALAYALVLGGLVWLDRHRIVYCGALFGLAALAKEPTLLCAGACVLACLQKRDWRAAVMLTFLSAAPFVTWQLYLQRTFGQLGVASGGGETTGFEWLPFGGLVRLFDVPAEFRGMALIAGVFACVFVVAPTLWSLLQLGRRITRDRHWDVEHWLLFANAALIPFVPTSTFAEPLGILRLIVGLQIGVVLVAAREQWARPLGLTTLWSWATILLVAIDFSR